MTFETFQKAVDIRNEIASCDKFRLLFLKGSIVRIDNVDVSKYTELRDFMVSFFEKEAEKLEQEFTKL